MRYEVWIDRGGTFTDCILLDRETNRRTLMKVPSSDRAPLIGIRALLQLSDSEPIPPCDIYMGTTIATNALLERKGAKTALVITRGFRDALVIGDQTRPSLFELEIAPRPQLYSHVFEIAARLDSTGAIVERPSDAELDALAHDIGLCGAKSVALVVLHSYAHPQFEAEIASRLLDRLRPTHSETCVFSSANTLPEQGIVGRAGACVVDAYVSPLVAQYLSQLERELPGSRVQLMQSSGGLTFPDQLRGPQAILSGPAGGIAQQIQSSQLVSLDMGGTSTDIALIQEKCDLKRETEIDGIPIRAPMLNIGTIASGGGSVCDFDGYRLTVGPDSVGADPGPLCYGNDTKDPSGRARVAITDVNVTLGRLCDDFFPFSLDPIRARHGLEELAERVSVETGDRLTPHALAVDLAALVTVQMAEAIRSATLDRGLDAKRCDLLVFGGAAGQHACAIARYLNIKRIIAHRLAGVLSAYGIGHADTLFQTERDAGRVELCTATLAALEVAFSEMEQEGIDGHRHRLETSLVESPRVTRWLELRYRGTEASIAVPLDGIHTTAAQFHAAHAARFGYRREETTIEVVTLRLQLRWSKFDSEVTDESPSEPSKPTRPLAYPRRYSRTYLSDGKLHEVPVYYLDDLSDRSELNGPALVLDRTGTTLVESGFSFCLQGDLIVLTDTAHDEELFFDETAESSIMGHRLGAIANQMGQVLRRTASSTNIRDRLDFSCALFDPKARLVANAPHIPVHLGAMSATVRAVMDRHPQMRPGDSYVSNDPALGGSHLPDITVITPVFDERETLLGFTASRGHHADIGGSTPGSMPTDSKRLEEEGIVMSALPLVRDGSLLEADISRLLSAGQFPARNPKENIADLEAQLAANRLGARLLNELSMELTPDGLMKRMNALHDLAARWVRDRIRDLPDGKRSFMDVMDDGTKIAVTVTVDDDRLILDFSDCSPQTDNNLNAPYAVTLAAVLYVLRLLVARPLPLNDGCLEPVKLILPPNSVVNPDRFRAVAAGNVETSQRIVDVLLAALDLCAASQGTMNNLSFGNETFGYYETIAGGTGAGPGFMGASATHSHMTNTRITDAEVLEERFPVRVVEFSVRAESGGQGRTRGGHGVIRELQALVPLHFSLLTDRRTSCPFGLAGGGQAVPGRNTLDGRVIPGRSQGSWGAGSRLLIETPGGGGYGKAD